MRGQQEGVLYLTRELGKLRIDIHDFLLEIGNEDKVCRDHEYGDEHKEQDNRHAPLDPKPFKGTDDRTEEIGNDRCGYQHHQELRNTGSDDCQGSESEENENPPWHLVAEPAQIGQRGATHVLFISHGDILLSLHSV